MDVFSFGRFFFFYVPLVLHTISEGERAFLHCTSSVMLHILGFYTVRLHPPSLHHGETSLLSASAEPIAKFCSEDRGGWFSDSLSAIAGRVRVVEQGFSCIGQVLCVSGTTVTAQISTRTPKCIK